MHRYFYILLLLLGGIIWQANAVEPQTFPALEQSQAFCGYTSCAGCCILSTFAQNHNCAYLPLSAQIENYLRPNGKPSPQLILFFIATIFAFFVWQTFTPKKVVCRCYSRAWARLPDELLL